MKEASKLIMEQNEAEKEGRKRRKERLAELRPAGYYKAQAQQAFNAFIRARDFELPCISCGENNPPDLHGDIAVNTGMDGSGVHSNSRKTRYCQNGHSSLLSGSRIH